MSMLPSLTPASAATLCFFGSAPAIAAFYTCRWGMTCKPITEIRPIVSQHFGHAIFLTAQTNWLIFSFFGFNLFFPNSPYISKLTPLIFALGAFLTPAYYGLDYFMTDCILERRLQEAEGYFPEFNSHSEHLLALPLVLAHVYYQSFSTIPNFNEVLWTVGGFMAQYLATIHFNKFLTGEYPYPIQNELASNPVGLFLFEASLVGVCMGLGYLGSRLMRLK